MLIRATAIVCAVRAHGEHGAVVRVLTRDHGLLAGYVRGGRSRRLRPVLMPGNTILAELRARVDAQLPAMTAELAHSRAAALGEPLAAAAVEWVTTLAAVTLAEGHPYPALHDALEGMLDAIALSPSARGWAGGLVRFERAMLAELGFRREGDGPTLLFEALRETGDALEAELLHGRAAAATLAARDRLVTRLARAFGVDRARGGAPRDAA